MNFKPLTAEEVEFVITVEPEFFPLEGSFASGDDEQDTADEDDIRQRLLRGDDSAWCILIVRAKWQGFEGVATLGGYTFPEGNTGLENRAYASDDFEDLKVQALEDLNTQLLETYNRLHERVA